MFNSQLRAFCALFFIIFISFSFSAYAERKTIGIIVPLEHEAMIQIVSGIKESLSGFDVNIEVKNAHSDSNLMLAIIKQMKAQNVDIIMPIGTATTQMTSSHIKNKPIIGVAALPSNVKNEYVTGLNDEIPVVASLSTLVKLRNITVIYSLSEKIASEIEELKAYALIHNVKLHEIMIQSLLDLPSAVKSAPMDTQAFLILKDHMVVSGINILTKEAYKRSVPVISSDEGSIINGASVAIGVKEKDIGTEAGSMVKLILEGISPDKIPYKNMDSLVVFVNEKAFNKQSVLTEDDIKALKMPVIKYQE